MNAGQGGSGSTSGRAELWILLFLAALVLLPHWHALVPGLTYYFRDFAVAFYPLRLFHSRELAQGGWPSWNPYIQEGSFVLPSVYPLDLLHVFWPGPAAVSWLLTLHFPLAALTFYALCRSLGATPTGACLSGCVYALGGLALSSLNLYVFLQALAVVPLVVLCLRRAALTGGRWIPAAALALGLAVTTLALEFVAQGLLLGLALGWAACSHGRVYVRGTLRMGLALVLGVGLAAVPVAVILGILSESVRGAGFPRDVALANDVHPVALIQVLIPGLFGSLSSPVEAFWGGAFFSKGFPYFLSLYLGPLALALAFAGFAGMDRASRWVVVIMGVLGLWYSLGSRGGLASAVVSWRVVRWFRFPSKAFLLPYLAVAILVGFGLCQLASRGEDGETRSSRAWRVFGVVAGILATLALIPTIALLAGRDAVLQWGGVNRAYFAMVSRSLMQESALAGAIALLGVGLSRAVLTVRLSRGRASDLLALLVGADLARAGMGLNPQVDPVFFRPLSEMVSLGLHDLGGGRVFSYGLDYSPAFRAFLAEPRRGKGLWSFFMSRQILAPYSNILDRVESAEAKDVTSFVPRPAELAVEDYDPAAVSGILARLRNAAVIRVISLDSLEHPDLRLLASVPAGPVGLFIRVYALDESWPRAYVACRVIQPANTEEALAAPYREEFDPKGDVALEQPGTADCRRGLARRLGAPPGREHYEVDLDGQGYLVMRDSYARGWNAMVDGLSTPVLRANGKHRAVPLPPGRHEVILHYRPPGLKVGLVAMAAAAVVTAFLWLRPQPHG